MSEPVPVAPQPERADDKAGISWWLVLGVFAFVIALWLGAHGLHWLHGRVSGKPGSVPPAESFESLNTLFSGLAFAGVILALVMQRRELMLQRQELEETREELKRSANAQELAERALFAAARVNTLQFLINAAGGEFIRENLAQALGGKDQHYLEQGSLAGIVQRTDGRTGPSQAPGQVAPPPYPTPLPGHPARCGASPDPAPRPSARHVGGRLVLRHEPFPAVRHDLRPGVEPVRVEPPHDGGLPWPDSSSKDGARRSRSGSQSFLSLARHFPNPFRVTTRVDSITP